MSDYALRDREAIESIVRMLIGTSYRDPRDGFGGTHMDELRGMRVPLQLSLARARYPDGSVDKTDLSPEILQEYVTGLLLTHQPSVDKPAVYESISDAYLAELPRKIRGMQREMRRFACFVAQGIMIGHTLNKHRISLICRMAGVNERAFAIDVVDALGWLYEQAEEAAHRYWLAKGFERVKVA